MGFSIDSYECCSIDSYECWVPVSGYPPKHLKQLVGRQYRGMPKEP